ncbi:MAG: hypothetical protein HYT09_01440 [Candidatus Levybacteria bacterium]|nr:hypothetical protein [Candidatus Levybacteria bacterium]
MRKSIKVFSFLIAIFIAFLFFAPAFAQENTGTTSSEDSVSSTNPRAQRTQNIREREEARITKAAELKSAAVTKAAERKDARASRAAERKEKLSEARIRVCKARAKNIQARIKSLHERAGLIHQRHEKILEMVDNFYNEKLVPESLVLPDYDVLKTDIEENTAEVAALLDQAKETGGEFDCESDDPKGQLDSFREDAKALHDAVVAYRKSVKAFIEAVRNLAKQAKSDAASESAETE